MQFFELLDHFYFYLAGVWGAGKLFDKTLKVSIITKITMGGR
jgi:hypothetical protein